MKILILIYAINLTFLNSQIALLVDEITGYSIKDVNFFAQKQGTTTVDNGQCNLDIFKKGDCRDFFSNWI